MARALGSGRQGQLAALVLALMLWLSPSARADQTGEPPGAQPSDAPNAEAPQPLPWQPGPLHVDLGHELSLDLSDRHLFLAHDAAAKVLERMGNFYNDDVLGLATSSDVAANWFVVIRYEEEGYIKDDEKIDAAELLSSLREGNEQANEERKERGFKPLTLDAWAEPPRYDSALHHLVWALVVSDSEGKSVNYNTRVLGRRGFASLNLVTEPEELGACKPEATALLAGTHFGKGARYEDYDSATDKTAEYGLAGLIAAGAGLGAAKLIKIGLIAKFWKLLLAGLIAGKKAIVLALAAGGAYLKKLLAGKKKEAAS